jgi:hypothetical protein
MVIHETVGVTEPIITTVDLVKYLKKQFAVLADLENGLFLITAGRDVINGTWIFNA